MFTDASEVLAAFIIIALMMEAAGTSETSVNFCQTTWCNIPEDSHLHTRRLDNMKSQLARKYLWNLIAPSLLDTYFSLPR
jgi:hypothetical protein